jgi:hypothetical protein
MQGGILARKTLAAVLVVVLCVLNAGAASEARCRALAGWSGRASRAGPAVR